MSRSRSTAIRRWRSACRTSASAWTADYGRTLGAAPQGNRAEDIATADAIEQRLWADFEAGFAQQHELSLAYRYLPRNDEELAVVLKYFPPVEFSLRKGAVEVNHRGIALQGEPDLEWDEVKSLQYNESSFGDSLTVTLHEKAMVGNKTRKLALAGLGKQKDDFNAAVGSYWHRHQVARGQARATMQLLGCRHPGEET